MISINRLTRKHTFYTAFIALLLLVLQGCKTPLVDVDIAVNQCESGMKDKETDAQGRDVGVCNLKAHGGANVTGFWDDATQRWMPTTNLKCQSGTICKSSPGTCTGGYQLCINHYNSTTKGCSCACPPAL